MPSLKKIKMAEYISGEREQSSQTRLPNGLPNGLCCAVHADEITNSGNKYSPRRTPKIFKAGERMLHDYECP